MHIITENFAKVFLYLFLFSIIQTMILYILRLKP